MGLNRKHIKLNQEVEVLYENLKHYNKFGKYIDDKLLVTSIKNYYGIPYNNEYNTIIKLPYIVAMAIQDNINKNRNLLMDMRTYFLKSVEEKLTIKYIYPKYKYINVRLLDNDNQGKIPRKDFIFADMGYTFIEDVPFIMTKVIHGKEELEYYEFNQLKSKELKFLTALTFLNINSSQTYKLNIKRGVISIPVLEDEENFKKSEIDKIKLIIKMISKLKNLDYNINFINNGSNYNP